MYEQLEVKAMEEALKTKEKMEAAKVSLENQLLEVQSEVAKLSGGKTTFKSLFSRGSKVEQVEKMEKWIPTL